MNLKIYNMKKEFLDKLQADLSIRLAIGRLKSSEPRIPVVYYDVDTGKENPALWLITDVWPNGFCDIISFDRSETQSNVPLCCISPVLKSTDNLSDEELSEYLNLKLYLDDTVAEKGDYIKSANITDYITFMVEKGIDYNNLIENKLATEYNIYFNTKK